MLTWIKNWKWVRALREYDSLNARVADLEQKLEFAEVLTSRRLDIEMPPLSAFTELADHMVNYELVRDESGPVWLSGINNAAYRAANVTQIWMRDQEDA